MKKKAFMICNIVSITLVIAFVVKTIVNYIQYPTTFTSAPFYLWVLVNALYFIIPAIVVFAVGLIIKKKK